MVVIETKRLLSGQLRVTYNGSLDIEAPDLTSYDLCNSLEKLEVEKVAGYYITERSPEQRDYLEKLYATRKKAALEGLDTDWLSKPLRTGIGHKHSLSFEMGRRKSAGDSRCVLQSDSRCNERIRTYQSGRKYECFLPAEEFPF